MAKMKELNQILDEMIAAGEQMIEAAASIKKYFSAEDPELDSLRVTDPVKVSAEKKVNERIEASAKSRKHEDYVNPKENEASVTPADAEKPALTKEDVRKLLVEKSALEESRYKEQVKALVREYSETGNLGGINPKRYEALAEELEVIGNA